MGWALMGGACHGVRMNTYSGRCHCGNVEVRFESQLGAAELPLRSCQCTFCLRHRTRTSTDPSGRATIRVRDQAQLSRYRFGLKLAQMLICRVCGCYAGALFESGGRTLAALNMNLVDD